MTVHYLDSLLQRLRENVGAYSFMYLSDLKTKKMPNTSGVYFFRDARGKVLYVGKATSLKQRVRSYFSDDLIKTRGSRIVDMVTRAKTVTWEDTDSVLEALVLEGGYIKKFQPFYNIEGKDDKSWNYVVVTREVVPRVLLVREKDFRARLHNKHYDAVFGPYPNGGELKEALRIVRRIFPFFDTKRPVTGLVSRMTRGKIEFYQQIGLYPKYDTGEAQDAYGRNIKHIKLFFSGKKKELLKSLEKGMYALARAERFEEASNAKRQIFALRHIQDISLIKRESAVWNMAFGGNRRIEAYDIAHLSGKDMVGVMVVVDGGEIQKSEYRKFNVKSVEGSNDTEALREILNRRFGHTEWALPRIVVVDGGKAQINVTKRVLVEFGYDIPVLSVVKNEKHKPKGILGGTKKVREEYGHEILLANAEAHRFAIGFHRKRRRVV
jgi:excinuclease ABC subunit C